MLLSSYFDILSESGLLDSSVIFSYYKNPYIQNMGTYNYGEGYSIKDHIKFDQYPYLIWGNTANSPQEGKAAIN